MSESWITFQKDPADVLDYQLDWAAAPPTGPWLGSAGDTIVTSTWAVPGGITKNSDTHDTTTTTIWLSGGTADTDYELTNTVVTAGGRTVSRTITIAVRER